MPVPLVSDFGSVVAAASGSASIVTSDAASIIRLEGELESSEQPTSASAKSRAFTERAPIEESITEGRPRAVLPLESPEVQRGTPCDRLTHLVGSLRIRLGKREYEMNKRLSKAKLEALEEILGVKLPETGFEIEIRPLSEGELCAEELDSVSGGTGTTRDIFGPIDNPFAKSVVTTNSIIVKFSGTF